MFRIGYLKGALLSLALLTASAPAWPETRISEKTEGEETLTAEEVKALKERADEGDADAQWELGYHYLMLFVDKRQNAALEEALPLLRSSAKKGNALAANTLGVIYSQGVGVDRNMQKAEKWFARSAELGEPVGMLNYALLLLGRDDDAGKVKARRLLEAASAQGLDLATYYLGRVALAGIGGKRNPERAVSLIKTAAEGGVAEAMFLLFRLYESGNVVTQDKKQALFWLTAAAERDYADAQWELGIRFVQGDGVRQDSQEAVKWFRKAADNGSLNGMTSLAVMYATGDGVEKDFGKAFELYSRAAELGSDHAMKNLAVMYFLGQHVDVDLVEAKKWLDIAAEQGNTEAAALQPVFAEKMTEEQKAEAERRKEAWLKSHSAS